MTPTQHTSPPALVARGVRRTYGKVTAVDGVDLRIEAGEVCALLGPNGAGKTTFLDMALGLLTPTSGSIEVLGTTPAAAVHQGSIGAVLQSDALLHDLSVRETVAMVAACHGKTIGVDAALEQAGAAHIAKRKVAKCSGGEKQRLRFALALLTEPRLLVLDEPTAGMDVQARSEFWQRMRGQADAGLTIIFATHYLQEAEDFAERVVLMRQGAIAADGTMAEITGDRQHHLSCTWRSDTSAQHVAQRLGASVTTSPARGAAPQRVHFHTHDSDALAKYLLTHDLAGDLEISAARLDEVFMDLATTTEGR